MNNYLYYFEFFSGFYESYFYKDLKAKNEKQAIIEIVAFFMNCGLEESLAFINESLGKRWTVEKFWNKMDMSFFNGSEGYNLIWIKKVNFNLYYS